MEAFFYLLKRKICVYSFIGSEYILVNLDRMFNSHVFDLRNAAEIFLDGFPLSAWFEASSDKIFLLKWKVVN